MPKKNQNKPNGFVIYANEIRDQLLMEGHVIRSMPDLIAAAAPKWEHLCAEEKEYYKERAKWEWENREGKSSSRKPVKPNRRDNTGAVVSDRVDAHFINEEKRKRERIEVFMSWPPAEAVLENKFYIVSFMCLLEEPYFQPIEVAAVEFSLLGGILRSWHKFINPGTIEVGYRYLAQNTSELTHKIPVEGIAPPEDTYTLIYDELFQFLSKGKTLPPIHVKMDECEKVEGCIRWLARKAGRPHQLKRIYELEGLILDLDFHMNGLPQNFLKSKQIGTRLISSTVYDWERGTNCNWHEDNESKFCALGYVNKYCFCIADYFCGNFNIPLTEKHLPMAPKEECYTLIPSRAALEEKRRNKAVKNESEDIANRVAQQLKMEADRRFYDDEEEERLAREEEQNQIEQKKRWLSLRGVASDDQSTRSVDFSRNMKGVADNNNYPNEPVKLTFGRGRGEGTKVLRQPGFGRGTKVFKEQSSKVK